MFDIIYDKINECHFNKCFFSENKHFRYTRLTVLHRIQVQSPARDWVGHRGEGVKRSAM